MKKLFLSFFFLLYTLTALAQNELFNFFNGSERFIKFLFEKNYISSENPGELLTATYLKPDDIKPLCDSYFLPSRVGLKIINEKVCNANYEILKNRLLEASQLTPNNSKIISKEEVFEFFNYLNQYDEEFKKIYNAFGNFEKPAAYFRDRFLSYHSKFNQYFHFFKIQRYSSPANCRGVADNCVGVEQKMVNISVKPITKDFLSNFGKTPLAEREKRIQSLYGDTTIYRGVMGQKIMKDEDVFELFTKINFRSNRGGSFESNAELFNRELFVNQSLAKTVYSQLHEKDPGYPNTYLLSFSTALPKAKRYGACLFMSKELRIKYDLQDKCFLVAAKIPLQGAIDTIMHKELEEFQHDYEQQREVSIVGAIEPAAIEYVNIYQLKDPVTQEYLDDDKVDLKKQYRRISSNTIVVYSFINTKPEEEGWEKSWTRISKKGSNLSKGLDAISIQEVSPVHEYRKIIAKFIINDGGQYSSQPVTESDYQNDKEDCSRKCFIQPLQSKDNLPPECLKNPNEATSCYDNYEKANEFIYSDGDQIKKNYFGIGQ